MDLAQIVADAFAALPEGLTQIVTFTRSVPGVFDPIADKPIGSTTLTWTGELVEEAARGTQSESFEEGVRVRTRFVQLTLKAQGLAYVPETGDRVTLADGETLTIAGKARVAPGGVAALYTIVAERV